ASSAPVSAPAHEAAAAQGGHEDRSYAPGGHPHDKDEHDDHADEKGAEHGHDHGGMFGEKTELIFSLTGGVFLLVGWLLERYATGPDWASLVCYVAAYGAAGYFTAKEAITNIRARRFEIDSLMLVAAIGA